jgi:signal transduction histidine kinase
MRERALLLGGEFVIGGEPNHGTRVSVLIPLSGSHRKDHAV